MYALEAAEHFCPWYSKAPRISAVFESFRIGRRVCHYKVFTTSFAHNAWIGFVCVHVFYNGFPEAIKVEVEPVKCKPAKYGSLKTTLLMSGPEPGTKFITPSGRPASL